MVAEERHTTSGFPVAPFHGEQTGTGPPPPGQFPFTRGFTPRGYRDGFWGWEMYAGFGGAEDANERYRFLLENGATGGVSIALDLPTQLGYDSDDPLAAGEVGRVGVALDTINDVLRMFDGVDLAEAGHVFTTANCIGPIAYAWMVVLCERRGLDPATFRVQIQNDPIKEYVARGTYFLPIEAAVRLATDTVVHSARHTPNWLPISVSGSHMKQAGATPALEAAFTIANAIAYMHDVEAKGLPLDQFNPTLELHFCTDMDFFEEVAKYRAVRRAWSELVRDRFNVSDDRMPFRLHAATSGLPLTAQQPMNNIARITLQVLAQALGGIEAGRTASWDEALAIPTEGAATLSLRINQIVAHETGITATTDPLGGSYYVEYLTDRIHDVIMEEVARVDELGGAVDAVHSGYYGSALAEGAYREQRALDRGERVVVGVNAYQHDENIEYPRFRVDEAGEARQIERLRQSRAARDDARVTAALERLAGVCRSDDNVVPAVLDAVRAGASVGEISSVWRDVFGSHVESRQVL